MRVLITLYLRARLWWLSHRRYKSVWVGFLYTLVIRVPSFCGVMSVSRNDMEPSGLVSSVVNMMAGSTELICCKNSFHVIAVVWQKCNLHIFSIFWEGSLLMLWPCSNDSIDKLATIHVTGDPMAVPLVCS